MQTTQSIEVIPGVERPVFGPTHYVLDRFTEAEATSAVPQPSRLVPGQLAIARHIHAVSYLASGLVTEEALVTDPDTELFSLDPEIDEVRGPGMIHTRVSNPLLPPDAYVDTAVVREAIAENGDISTAPQSDVLIESPAFMEWLFAQGEVDATKVVGSFGNIPTQDGRIYAMHSVYREPLHHAISSGSTEVHAIKVVPGMIAHLRRYLGQRNYPELGEFRPIEEGGEGSLTTTNAMAVPSAFRTDEFLRNTARDLEEARTHADSAAVLNLEQGLLYYSAQLPDELLHEQAAEARAQIIAAYELEVT